MNISLSQPSHAGLEKKYLFSALIKNQISKGEYQALFASEIAKIYGSRYVNLTNSGTSALHLIYKYFGIKNKSRVLVPDLTFAGTVFPLNYLLAEPIFLDINLKDFNLDINLFREYITRERKKYTKPIWLIGVDIFGFPNDYAELIKICKEYEVRFILDGAESLGSKHKNFGVFDSDTAITTSFNGNKIVTCGGGGAIISNSEKIFKKINFWINQSRENTHWYEHREIGFNYRLSNLHAAFGYAQIKKIDEFISRRRQIRSNYIHYLDNIDAGIRILQDNPNQFSNAWLTVVNFSGKGAIKKRNAVHAALTENSVESRFVWKPMSMQPIFRHNKSYTFGNSEKAFKTSLCLPSHPDLSKNDQEKIVYIIKKTIKEIK